jgi:ABC-type bacteriocin/lantibiotic exporter with double-glycine peptidase domain
LKSQILRRLLDIPAEFFDKQSSGYLVGRVSEADSVTAVFSPSIFQFIAGLIEAVGALAIVTSISGEIALLMLPFLPTFFVLTTWTSRRLRQSTVILKESSAITHGGVQEMMAGITEIKLSDAEGRKLNDVVGQYRSLASKSVSQSISMAVGNSSLGMLTNVLSVAITIFIGIMITRDQLTIGDYVALSGYSMKVFGPVQMFGNLSLILQPAVASMKRLGIFFESETEREIWGTSKVSSIDGKITFKGVSFGYDSTSEPILKDCSFSILPGQSVAIIGDNGAGKSTVLKLILGMYHNYRGEILLDDVELREYDIISVRSRVGVVSQHVVLFRGSLADNVRIASPDASDGRMGEVLEVSGCARLFGDKLNERRIEEHGKNLSGGQRQAAAIARCLLKNPDVLMFDEATTHLDTIARHVVLDAFQNAFREKTRIIVTHDCEIARIADRVYLLENGKVKELLHSELV